LKFAIKLSMLPIRDSGRSLVIHAAVEIICPPSPDGAARNRSRALSFVISSPDSWRSLIQCLTDSPSIPRKPARDNRSMSSGAVVNPCIFWRMTLNALGRHWDVLSK